MQKAWTKCSTWLQKIFSFNSVFYNSKSTWKGNADSGDNIPVYYIFGLSNGQTVDKENPEGHTELHARPKGTLNRSLGNLRNIGWNGQSESPSSKTWK